ncbi:MAG: glycosyltransferase family 4 protein [Bradymonadaceae bacterium]|nr:glycosyltransferase family 4 protein [Lujinxingiaceae bacterium]
MARIYLDARNITAEPAGVARYARCLIPELVAQGKDHEFIVIRHASNRTPLELDGPLKEVFIDRPIDNLSNFLFGSRSLRQVFATNGPADLYHDLFHILPRGAARANPGAPCKVVVTLHDFVWIDHARDSQSSWLSAKTIEIFARSAIPHALRAADHVISISEPTTARATAYIDAERITTIPHGVTPEFFAHTASTTRAFSEPYVVAVGNDKRYKNLHLLIEAFAIARKKLTRGHLVLIGNCKGLDDAIAQAGISEHVTRTGFLSDEALRDALASAQLFVFPSLVEGFGLPILEAMAMGVPTLVCDLEPMRTIGADAALRFSPHDATALATLIERVFEDESLHTRLASAGRARASEFRWPLTAEKTLAVYERVLSTPQFVDTSS